MTARVPQWQAGCAVAVLLAYLVPEWLAWAHSPVFVFVNGWDEETYLSWQGVLGSRNEIGYFSLWPYSVLHAWGVSGALQNLWSDTLLPLASVALITAAVRRFGITLPRAFAYAVLILFSSTLFNYANPVVKFLLGDYDGRAWLMAGWELYPSVLRTPNPQVSYFLIALALYAWSRWKRDWLLLLPLPLLYYFVAVPYAGLLALAAGWRVWVRRYPDVSLWSLMGGGVVLWLGMGAAAAMLFWVAGYYVPDHWIRQDTWVYAATRQPQFPLILLFFAVGYGLLNSTGCLDSSRRYHRALLALAVVALASANLHVLTGFMLSQKNYYDYGLSIVFGVMLVALTHGLRPGRMADSALVVPLILVSVPTLASHLYFYQRAVSISERAVPVVQSVRDDPLHTLILDREVSSRMAYAHAEMLTPPFSYQYYFPFIERQCVHYPALLEAAVTLAHRDLPTGSPDRAMLDETVRHIRDGQKRAARIPYQHPAYCLLQDYRPQGYRLFGSTQ